MATPTDELRELVRLVEQARDLLDDREAELDRYIGANPDQAEALLEL